MAYGLKACSCHPLNIITNKKNVLPFVMHFDLVVNNVSIKDDITTQSYPDGHTQMIDSFFVKFLLIQ